MENRWDFLEWLGSDTSTNVLMRLDDPADFMRLSSVSRSWWKFVIENGFCKKLCIRMFPDVSNFSHVIELSSPIGAVEVGSSSAMEWEGLEREHRVYAYLCNYLLSSMTKRNCILEPIGASSTDNLPDESIHNTLEPRERVYASPSYWSSKGEKDPGVPEKLTYRLESKLWIVNEIKIQPFKAYFQYGCPIYSAKSVRFRMGYSKSAQVTRKDIRDKESTDDNYIWTYISPKFPMAQENVLQSFKLPRPVICIGGILQIELLGRVQRQEIDGLYYVCVCHVKVIGRALPSVLSCEIVETMGSSTPVLKYSRDPTGCRAIIQADVKERPVGILSQ